MERNANPATSAKKEVATKVKTETRVERVLTGNEAVAYGVLLARAGVVTAYPITPQTSIAEKLAQFSAEGKLQGEYTNTESELSSMAICIGASSGGVRAFTATSSQGLALMHEQLHWASGARLPIVMAVVNRPLAAPWNLTCDQSDSLSQRDAGWLQLYCADNQEVIDTTIQAFKIAEETGVPTMMCLDGVYLSHTAAPTEIPDQAEVDAFLPPYNAIYRVGVGGYKLFTNNEKEAKAAPTMRFFLTRYRQHQRVLGALQTMERVNAEFAERFGRSYPAVESYRMEDAEIAVVISGSATGTVREVVDELRGAGVNVGMVKMRVFRPFPVDLVRAALRGVKKLAVIDRNLSPGTGGIFCQEIKAAIQGKLDSLPVYGYISGLGGEDITPELVERAIRYTIENDVPKAGNIWLGLDEEGDDEFDRDAVKIW